MSLFKKEFSAHFSFEEINQRNQNGEVLVICKNKVYNLTKFGKFHPGGQMALEHMKGKDATDAIIAFHPPEVLNKRMHAFCIGELAKNELPVSTISESWRKLEAKMHEIGLFESKPSFWFLEVAKFCVLWAVMITLAVKGGDNLFMHLLSAISAAILWHQAAFMGHDGGHNGITHVRFYDTWICICLANALGGISIGWWKKSHNTHHVVTNSVEHDPDIQHMPFFAVSTKFFKSIYSTYHKREMTFGFPAKVLVSLQHYLFYIILCFGRFNLYVQSLIYLADETVSFRKSEIVGLCFFWAWFSFLLSFMPSWPVLAAYVFISHAATMLLHVQITISHFGMPTDDVPNETFAEKALRTSMDVDCPKWMDWFHGGLQFQVIHHLFPRLPRHNLRAAKPLIQQFAKENGLTYHSHGFLKSNALVLGQLKQVADQVKFILRVNDHNISKLHCD